MRAIGGALYTKHVVTLPGHSGQQCVRREVVSLAVELLLLVHTGLLAAAFPLSRLCLVVVAAAG